MKDLRSNERIKGDEPFVLASITTTVLGTLAGMLVDDGVITWTTTIRQLFPELAGKVQPKYLEATLHSIACNRSGIPGAANYDEWNKLRNEEPGKARYSLMANYVLRLTPVSTTRDEHGLPGSTTLAAMLERASGKSLEQLCIEKLRTGLGMTSFGFGPPERDGRLVGFGSHVTTDSGKVELIPFRFQCGVSFHCNAADLCKLGQLYLDALEGKSRLLTVRTAQVLLTAHPKGNESPAWRVVGRSKWFYAGSTGGEYTLLSINGERRSVVAGTVNSNFNDCGMRTAHQMAESLQ